MQANIFLALLAIFLLANEKIFTGFTTLRFKQEVFRKNCFILLDLFFNLTTHFLVELALKYVVFMPNMFN